MKKILIILLVCLSINGFSQSTEQKNSFVNYLSEIFKIDLHSCAYTIYSKDSFELEQVTFYNSDYTERIFWNKERIQLELRARGTHIPSCSTIRSHVYDFDSVNPVFFKDRDVLSNGRKNR